MYEKNNNTLCGKKESTANMPNIFAKNRGDLPGWGTSSQKDPGLDSDISSLKFLF